MSRHTNHGTYHVGSVVNDGQIDEVRLHQSHRLARMVFEPEISESQHGTVPPKHRNMDLDLWRERLKMPSGNVLYVMDTAGISNQEADGYDTSTSTLTLTSTSQDTRADSTAPPTERMIGMFLNYPRRRDGLESYHVFISAVDPSARGKGLFTVLLDATKDYARSTGYKTLTVSTLPDTFERMFAILSKEGSGWEVVEWQNEGEKGARKVLMKMVLD